MKKTIIIAITWLTVVLVGIVLTMLCDRVGVQVSPIARAILEILVGCSLTDEILDWLRWK